MPPIPDLVRLSRLDAELSTDLQQTRHVYFSSRPGQRSVRKEALWERTAQPLGSGGFGMVYLEECILGNRKGGFRAVKSMRKPTLLRPKDIDYGRELEAIALFSQQRYDRCFVKSLGWYEYSSAVFIAMEYMSHGDLHQYLGSPFPEVEAKQIVSQVLEGLDYMHDFGFAHRDLKSANLLVASQGPQWWVKIADFGISKRVVDEVTSLRTQVGTPAFIAPEVAGFGDDDSSDDEPSQSYTNAVDIWAVGVIAYMILTGQPLFQEIRQLKRYVQGKMSFPADILTANQVSTQGRAFVRSLVSPKPMNRPGAKASRNHSWLEGLGDLQLVEAPFLFAPQESTKASASWSALDSGYQTEAPVTAVRAGIQYSWMKNRTDLRLAGHSKDISCLAFSPDGRLIASASEDGKVMFWSVVDGRAGGRLQKSGPPGGKLGAQSVAFSPDSKRIVSIAGHGSGTWDIATCTILHSFVSPQDYRYTFAAALSPDGKLLASSLGAEIRLWDAITGKLFLTLEAHADPVLAAVFSPNGKFIASGSYDYTVRLWDTVKGRLLHTLKDHTASVWDIVFSPDGTLLASVSGDNIVRLWDTATGAALYVFENQYCGRRGSIAFSFDGKTFASISGDNGMVVLRDTMTGSVRHTLAGGRNCEVHTIAFSPNGRLLALASYHRITIVDPVSGKSLSTFGDSRSGFEWGFKVQMRFSPDSKVIAWAGRNHQISLWQHRQ